MSSGTDSVVTANPGSTQTWTITGTSSLGCNSTATVSVSVDKPSVTATAVSPSICTGGSTVINASGGTSYVWYPSAGLTSTTGASVTADSTASGSYWVVGTDAKGCKDSANVNITVSPLPAVSVVASDTSMCAGNSATLTASGASMYTWTPTIGLSSSTGMSVTANPSGTETYTVTGKTAAGCISSAQITITVNSSPTVSINLSGGSTLCPGASVTMTASGASNYSWSPSSILSSSTGASVTASPTSSPIVITVVGVNGVCSDSAKQTLNLYPALTATMAPTDSTCAGDPAILSVTANGGDPAYTYTWSAPLSTNTGPGPYVVNPTIPTTYSCTVTDQCGRYGYRFTTHICKIGSYSRFYCNTRYGYGRAICIFC